MRRRTLLAALIAVVALTALIQFILVRGLGRNPNPPAALAWNNTRARTPPRRRVPERPVPGRMSVVPRWVSR